jgi:hypothetical protein
LSGEKQGELSEESFPLHPLKDFYGETAALTHCHFAFFCEPNEQSEVEANRGVCPLGTAKRQR